MAVRRNPTTNRFERVDPGEAGRDDTGDPGNSGGSSGGNDGGNDGGNSDPATILGRNGEPGNDGTGGGDNGDDFVRDGNGERIRNRDGSWKRRPGRRRGGKSRPDKPRAKPRSSEKVAVSGIESVLLSTHQILAAVAKSPELELTDSEANALATGIANVARHYPTTIDPKTVDLFILVTLLMAAYWPRIVNIRERRAAERARNVTPRPPGGLQLRPVAESPPPAAPPGGAAQGPPAMDASGMFVGLRSGSTMPPPAPGEG